MKPALVVIDYQRWFFRTAERRTRLAASVRSTNELIEFFHCHVLPIVHILTVHKADGSTWSQLMKKGDFAVMIEGTRDVEELPELKTFDTDTVVIKTRHSSFIRTGFEQVLRELGVDTLVLTGAFIDGCVGLTAIDAHERDFSVVLARDAILGLRNSLADAMLELLRDEFEIKSLSDAKVEELVAERCSSNCSME